VSKWAAAGATLTITVLLWATTAHATDVSIPIETAIEAGFAQGELVELAAVPSADLVGATCTVRSVHTASDVTNRGNDLIISSGNSSTTLTDVEREPGAVTEASSITLGLNMTVTLLIGPDEQFAGEIDLELGCEGGGIDAAAASEAPAADPAAGAATPTATAQDQLPNTGWEATTAILALAFLVVGYTLRLAARRPSRS
jgi:hypothetical protein